jgi:glycosyltransferase involved in cell wall biosynthesis
MITVCTATIEGREEMLKEAIASVEAQTFGVTDHLILKDEKRRGGFWTKQQLLDQVKTEFAILLDDDDLLDPNYCERLMEKRNGADVVYGWCRSDVGFETYNQAFSGHKLDTGVSIVPQCAIFRTDAARAAGGVPQKPAYDLLMWQAMYRNGAKFESVTEQLWTYRLSPRWWHESRP